MIRRLLIANRGEIAVRIIRACREMGISTVAVYSDADANSPHVALADAAARIGPPPAPESYLSIDAILQAAKDSLADAIHPGYGFLSERAEFAEACGTAGITFVGPTSSAIQALGDKIAARQRMQKAGVPVTPGYAGDDQSDSKLRGEAHSIGVPLLIKAAGGGGGRGMRLVESLDSFEDALIEARKEADSAFGDSRVLLERYVTNPRHVEVQIFGDASGNVVHLFERECSIQRRHQKIIEESPSPIMTPELRARMTEAAVLAGKAVGYTNAGTVEFLVEEQPGGNHQFYFMEVNARLQVEHPVTESVTGIDLVNLQLRIASGQAIPWRQEQIAARGHSIEVRIYAEDPATGFLPSIGRLLHWIEPQGPGIRVDSGVQRGSEVSPYYDPMLAKLIVSGSTREEAVARLEQALLQFHVLGVRTNISYLLAIVRHPDFRDGRTHTGFLAQHFAGWKADAAVPEEVLLGLAAESITRPVRQSRETAAAAGDMYSPWKSSGGWRPGGPV